MCTMWIEIFSVIGSWLLATIAVERLAEAIVESEPAAIILRNPLGTLAYNSKNPVALFFHKLLMCGWCTSGWVSLIVVWMLPGSHNFMGNAAENVVIQWMALWGLSSLFHNYFMRVKDRIQSHVVNLITTSDTDDIGTGNITFDEDEP